MARKQSSPTSNTQTILYRMRNLCLEPVCLLVTLFISLGSLPVHSVAENLTPQATKQHTSITPHLITFNSPAGKAIDEQLQSWYKARPLKKTLWQDLASSDSYTTDTAIALLHVRPAHNGDNAQGLGVEPLCDCPDFAQVKSKAFHLAELSARKALVTVGIELNSGEKRVVTLSLLKPNKFWQIDNIQSDTGFDLRKVALRNPVPNPPTGVINEHSAQIVKQLQIWYDRYRVNSASVFTAPKAYLTQSTAAQLIRIQNNTPRGEINSLQGDPFVVIQDPGAIKNVRFHVLSADPKRAEVEARMLFEDNPDITVKLQLHHENRGWRVHNFYYADVPDFRSQMRSALYESGY